MFADGIGWQQSSAKDILADALSVLVEFAQPFREARRDAGVQGEHVGDLPRLAGGDRPRDLSCLVRHAPSS